MVLFVMLGLGRCRSGAVERRSWLGFGGVCIVVASGLAAYGINSGFGERPPPPPLPAGRRQQPQPTDDTSYNESSS